jgi:hypothetical protein
VQIRKLWHTAPERRRSFLHSSGRVRSFVLEVNARDNHWRPGWSRGRDGRGQILVWIGTNASSKLLFPHISGVNTSKF